MDYFRCIDCENLRQEENGDDRDADGESFRCYECVNLRKDRLSALHLLTDTGLEIIANEPDLDMETDPRFEYDEEEDGYNYIGNV
jgi:hypothetical protein